MTEPTPAATLILWRDGPPAEILMVERAATMVFAAGAMVFPGGRVDAADRLLADGAPDQDEVAAKIAAIRETIEEVGLAVAIDPVPDPATLSHWRAALADGSSFPALLEAGGYRLLLDQLLPFARWCPPGGTERRTFDTRFFLASAPADAQPVADGSESVHAVWATPQEILADAAARRRHIIFPTLRNLERLATLADFEAARAHAAAFPVRMICPHIERRDDGDWLCIPDGLGYPVLAQPLTDVRRG